MEWDRSADGYRLPTEAEWEYAARASSQTAYYSGPSGELGADDVALHKGNTDVKRPHEVATRHSNAWGLHDTSGNVWEWVWDWYGEQPGEGSATDPVGPGGGSGRVRRGGSWYSSARNARTASRARNDPRNVSDDLGFRLARSP